MWGVHIVVGVVTAAAADGPYALAVETADPAPIIQRAWILRAGAHHTDEALNRPAKKKKDQMEERNFAGGQDE